MAEGKAQHHRLRALARLAVLPALLVAVGIVAWRLGYFHLEKGDSLGKAIDRLAALRATSAVFVLLYGAVVAVGLPCTPLTLIAGAIFGTVHGAIVSWIGAMLGTTAAYWLARGIGRPVIEHALRDERWLLDRVRQHGSFLNLLRLRLVPMAPFAYLDYAAGIAGLGFLTSLGATAGGTVVGSVAYAYVGQALRAGFAGGERRALVLAAAVTAGLFALSFLPNLFSRLRGERRQARQET